MLRNSNDLGSSTSVIDSVEGWLDFSAYVTKYRFCSYWHQINEVLRSKPESVLEIGVGGSVVSGYLARYRWTYVNIDIESKLKPGIVGSITNLPLKEKVFDTVLCCQVLEHLPFQRFGECLTEIRRVCRKKLVLSLPDKSPAVGILVRVPNFIFWDFMMPFPFAVREPLRKGKAHQWEIGRLGYPWWRITKEIIGAGYRLEKTYRVPEYPYHRFFISSPRSAEMRS